MRSPAPTQERLNRPLPRRTDAWEESCRCGDAASDFRATTTAPKPPLPSRGGLESICGSLADTTHGPAGSEIQRLLSQARIRNTDPGESTWKHLFPARVMRHNGDGSAGRVFTFVKLVMDPPRDVGAREVFEDRAP